MYTKLSVTRSYVYNVAKALDGGERVPKVRIFNWMGVWWYVLLQGAIHRFIVSELPVWDHLLLANF